MQVAQKRQQKTNNRRKQYCIVCGKKLIEYPEYKRLYEYDAYTGEPIYIGNYMRCSDNPCHQGHDWEDYGTWWENMKIKWKNWFLFSNKVRCKRCGKIDLRF